MKKEKKREGERSTNCWGKIAANGDRACGNGGSLKNPLWGEKAQKNQKVKKT